MLVLELGVLCLKVGGLRKENSTYPVDTYLTILSLVLNCMERLDQECVLKFANSRLELSSYQQPTENFIFR